MTARVPKYEAVVLVKDSSTRAYNSFLGLYCEEEQRKMFHIDARTDEQARKKAKKYGKPLSVRKYHPEDRLKNIENIKLNQEPLDVFLLNNQFNKALAMDEFIWKKQNKKRKYLHLDKQMY